MVFLKFVLLIGILGSTSAILSDNCFNSVPVDLESKLKFNDPVIRKQMIELDFKLAEQFTKISEDNLAAFIGLLTPAGACYFECYYNEVSNNPTDEKVKNLGQYLEALKLKCSTTNTRTVELWKAIVSCENVEPNIMPILKTRVYGKMTHPSMSRTGDLDNEYAPFCECVKFLYVPTEEVNCPNVIEPEILSKHCVESVSKDLKNKLEINNEAITNQIAKINFAYADESTEIDSKVFDHFLKLMRPAGYCYLKCVVTEKAETFQKAIQQTTDIVEIQELERILKDIEILSKTYHDKCESVESDRLLQAITICEEDSSANTPPISTHGKLILYNHMTQKQPPLLTYQFMSFYKCVMKWVDSLES